MVLDQSFDVSTSFSPFVFNVFLHLFSMYQYMVSECCYNANKSRNPNVS